MAVVVIMGLLAGLVGAAVIGNSTQARTQTAARADQAARVRARPSTRWTTARFPTTDQGLHALVEKPSGAPEPRNYRPGGYLEGRSVPQGPWGTPYQYDSPGPAEPAGVRHLVARRRRRAGRRRRRRRTSGNWVATSAASVRTARAAATPDARRARLHADRGARGARDLRADRGVVVPEPGSAARAASRGGAAARDHARVRAPARVMTGEPHRVVARPRPARRTGSRRCRRRRSRRREPPRAGRRARGKLAAARSPPLREDLRSPVPGPGRLAASSTRRAFEASRLGRRARDEGEVSGRSSSATARPTGRRSARGRGGDRVARRRAARSTSAMRVVTSSEPRLDAQGGVHAARGAGGGRGARARLHRARGERDAGPANEGESGGASEASLLADRELAEIEAALAVERPLPTSASARARRGVRDPVEVAPLDGACARGAGDAAATSARARRREARRRGAAVQLRVDGPRDERGARTPRSEPHRRARRGDEASSASRW